MEMLWKLAEKKPQKLHGGKTTDIRNKEASGLRLFDPETQTGGNSNTGPEILNISKKSVQSVGNLLKMINLTSFQDVKKKNNLIFHRFVSIINSYVIHIVQLNPSYRLYSIVLYVPLLMCDNIYLIKIQ